MKWILAFAIICIPVLSAQELKPALVKSINFIQDEEVSKLIIDLDKASVAKRTHIKDDKQIILDLENAIAGKKQLRGIDTSEFTGSTVYISPYKRPGKQNDLRIAIQLRDNVRSILESKNNRITLSIENRFGVFSKRKLDKAEKSTVSNSELEEVERNIKINVPKSNSVIDILENITQAGVKKYVGKKISINVNSVPYQEILRMISETSGFNIIIDNEVNSLPPLTISLTNIPWDQALDTILSLGDLVAFKTANILNVKTARQAREERQRELDSLNANRLQEPLVTKIFPVSFANPAELIVILTDYLTKDRGTIQVDNRTSNLIVKDTVEVIERMKKIIETLDTETPQVLIESKIVEATENYSFRAGLSAGGLSFNYDPFTRNPNSGEFNFSSAPTANAPGFLGANIAVFRRLIDLDFSLELMESEQKGRIISSPKVITQNNQAAQISSNDTRRVFTTVLNDGGGAAQQLTDLTAQISLNVTPKVTNDGSISMNVAVQKSGFLQPASDDEAPGTSEKNITTNVLVDNGATIVIGGLYQTNTNEIESGVPYLKDLPLIGWLFRNAYSPNRTRSELIVFLTPRIVNQEEAGLVNRDSGTNI